MIGISSQMREFVNFAQDAAAEMERNDSEMRLSSDGFIEA